MTTAAVYARISQDRTKEGAGVARQVADAKALAKARGWTVVETFIENETSATNGKPRPQWLRMLAAVRAREFTHVVAWKNDRLYRRTRDQLELMEAVREAGGAIATVNEGEIDPTTPEGRMQMGILASVAQFEADRISERVQAAVKSRVESGKPHGRPSYGWRRGPGGAGDWVIDHDAASIIQECARRVLAGETTTQIAADFDARGIPTPSSSNAWHPFSIVKLLRRPATAGLREYNGKVVGKGTWPAILGEETWERVVARLAHPGQRRARKYLLSGMVRCTKDGERMTGHRLQRPGYSCTRCQRRVDAERLDAMVEADVLDALATPRVAKRLARARTDSTEADALRDLERADKKLAELAEMFAADELERFEYEVARTKVVENRARAERRLSAHRSALVEAVASPEGIRDLWARQPMAWRREVIRAVIQRIDVGPGRGGPTWDPKRVAVTWAS